nr:hypothetical protein [uncultured Marinifilum sp.]
MKNKNSQNLNVRKINLNAESLKFTFIKDGNYKDEISINTGIKYVCERFFKGDIPKDDEVEISIYYVEETALSNKALMNNNEKLICDHKLLTEIFHKNVGDVISFAEIEEVNHKYFDVIAGVPESVIEIQFTKKKFTLILILRAIMHVLKFKGLEIVG